MGLAQWKAFREADHFFDNQFFVPVFKPEDSLAIDVYEQEGDVIVEMDVPGVDLENINITVEDDVLSVSGERLEETETKEKEYYSKEIKRGSFYRLVQLPKEVDAHRAEARCRDGHLVFTAPARKSPEGKGVSVKVTG